MIAASQLAGRTLAERLKAALAFAGITKAELARRTGLSRTAVSLLLNGQSKSLKGASLLAIEEATGVSARWIESGEGPPEQVKYRHTPEQIELLRAAERLTEYELKQAIRLVKALHVNHDED